MNEKKDINSPEDYENIAVIAHEAGDGILSRLDWMVLQPKKIIDMSCRTGEMSIKLKAHYPTAQVVSLDHSHDMLTYAHTKGLHTLCADVTQLPFADKSVDLIVANLLFAWCSKPELLLREWYRVLRHEGILILSGFGPDTLCELNPNMIIPNRIDMHHIGDLLLQTAFKEPVADVDYCTLTYSDSQKMQHELQVMGLIVDGTPLTAVPLQATFELIYAHAFVDKSASSAFRADESGIVRIPLSSLQKNKTKS